MDSNHSPQLKVSNPCPFVPKESNRNCEGFHCKGCNKTIIDFRGMTESEILRNIDENTCGIFDSDQLPGQQSISWSKKPLFYGMMLMSFLGFSVRPIYAQTPDTVNVKVPEVETNAQRSKVVISEQTRIDPSKGTLLAVPPRKEKVFRTIGCPSF